LNSLAIHLSFGVSFNNLLVGGLFGLIEAVPLPVKYIYRVGPIRS
jgi:hypothetical protein